MDTERMRAFARMSPFEIKDELIRLARQHGRGSAGIFLNAGRGNPNWLAIEARDAFFLLGQFAMEESRQAYPAEDGFGGMPRQPGVAARCEVWLAQREEARGAAFLRAMLPFASARFGFEADAFLHELADAIAGDNYPTPPRMLPHVEAVVQDYVIGAMCGTPQPVGRFALFATEGATAGICDLFRSLRMNRLLLPGDTVAIACPIFTPYLGITALEDHGLRALHLQARAEEHFQFTDPEFARLEDPTIKALLLVNPGNPTSVALDADATARIVSLVREHRSDLIIVTDDVYCTFVEGFRSLMAELPRNTVGLYSFSKYFGATGWRLGVVALHEDNVLDALLAAQPEAVKHALDDRYGGLCPQPRALRFIDRMVADSRDIALNHTAGLSTPQQAMMALFALAELMDDENRYRAACTAMLRRRSEATIHALGIDGQPNPLYSHYYGLIDFEYWMRTHLGDEALAWMKRFVHPLDIVFRLAEEHGIVLLNGGGFHAPDWSARISFANLPDEAYQTIGEALRAVARHYQDGYEAAQRTGQAK